MLKKIILLLFLQTVFTYFLSAQQIIKGPMLNYDLMTYFQDEMTSLMQFQRNKWENGEEYGISPFFISTRTKDVTIDLDKIDSEGHLIDGSFLETDVINGLLGIQLKITENFYIPLFVCMSKYTWGGTVDDGTMVINNVTIDNGYGNTDNDNSSYYMGSGLIFTNETFTLGVYAGYYLENYKNSYSGSNWTQSAGWQYYPPVKNEGTNHSFKIALIPDANVSEWNYVGKVLNKVLGYIGMGNTVEVYAGEEEKGPSENIAKLLNYGLNLSFKMFNLGNFGIEPHFYYSRENYDVPAKAETFGLSLLNSFSIVDLALDFGYKNFYSASKYFISCYPNTWFFNVGLSFTLFKVSSLNFYFSFDDIRWDLIIVFDIKEAFSILTQGPYHLGGTKLPTGVRYRHPKGVFERLFG